jgi:hypothetical protein
MKKPPEGGLITLLQRTLQNGGRRCGHPGDLPKS